MTETLNLFTEAVRAVEEAGINYAVFGGIAVWEYGPRRDTKDIDFLVCPSDADGTLAVLERAGFEVERTDPAWLYKATKNDVDVDLIFEVAGGEVPCERVLARKRRATIGGIEMDVISPEDLVAIKLAVIKPHRCWDWYDAISVLKGTGGKLDWDYLIERCGPDIQRLLGLLLFAKTAGCDAEVPEDVLKRLARLAGLV